MSDAQLRVALVRDVFWGEGGDERLESILQEAKQEGAELAVLPELPLDPWLPSSQEASDNDAEPPDGPRAQRLQKAAARSGIGLVGGAIVRDRQTQERFSTALVIDSAGNTIAACEKLHLPEEEGFWETSHYHPGRTQPVPVDGFGMRLGLQICSDVNRPQGCHLLSAGGAEVILNPRASESATWHRWKPVLIANALTSCCYVASINRPGPERGVAIGGPTLMVDPNGEVLIETEDTLVVATLRGRVIAEARTRYPGYLDVRSSLYARGWAELSQED